MGKKKKRLQMQKITDKQFVSQVLADGVGLGLLDQVGYDEHGEPIYTMKPNFEERLELIKKTFNIDQDFNE
jgi:hypothetical protein